MQPKQEEKNTETKQEENLENSALGRIIEKIRESDSILIALSQNPSIDELATAIGLGMFIDKMGKHATAIYSGATPNVLAFLQPEQQFETNTNSLQDFIIAINKDKADHLRYKLDGDYVKVYITPYRTTISESDLEFSHGDYNVDLVIALNVGSADQLDAALSEHGKIMHDATIVNVATTASGKFGEIEWLDPAASSVAEMIAGLMIAMQEDTQLDGEIATAVLTGIVAATERFSNGKTQPKTMSMASQLMSFGANQQLISENIIKEEAPKAFEVSRGGEQQVVDGSAVKKETLPSDNTVLDVQAAVKAQGAGPENIQKPVENVMTSPAMPAPGPVAPTASVSMPEPIVMPTPTTAPAAPTTPPIIPLETAAVMPTSGNEPVLPPVVPTSAAPEVTVPEFSGTPVLPQVAPTMQETQNVEPTPSGNPSFPVLDSNIMAEINKVPEPAPEATDAGSRGLIDEEKERIQALPGVSGKDYGSMIEAALSESGQNSQNPVGSGYIGGNPAIQAAPGVLDEPEENNLPDLSFDQPINMSDEREKPMGEESFLANSPMKTLNPTDDGQMGVTVNNMENETGLPMPGEGTLPPPPTPPLSFSADELPQVTPVGVSDNNFAGALGQEMNQSAQPIVQAAPEQNNEESNPGAFKIPGM